MMMLFGSLSVLPTPAPIDPITPPAPPPPPSAPSAGNVGEIAATDMEQGNDNGWYLDVAPNTADSNGPGGRYPYIALGLRRSDGGSYWPNRYLDDLSYDGQSWNMSTPIRWQPWYVCGRATQSVPRENLRLHILRAGSLAMRLDGSWELFSEQTEVIFSANWHANFRSPGNEIYRTVTQGSALDHARVESPGSSIGSIGYGQAYVGNDPPRWERWALHGFPQGRTLTTAQWVNTYRGLFHYVEARLILHNPGGPDHRSNSGLMFWMGSDFYANGSSYLQEHCHARLKVVGGGSNFFTASSVPPALLRSNPPPV